MKTLTELNWEILTGDNDLVLIIKQEETPVTSIRISVDVANQISDELRDKARKLERSIVKRLINEQLSSYRAKWDTPETDPE